MRLLLDSHFALWLTLDRSHLSVAEMALLSDTANEVAASAVSIWELRIKWEKRFTSGERKGKVDPQVVLQTLRRLGVPVFDLTADHVATVLRTAASNNDPFDEQLLIHAQELGMRLLTRDKKLVDHPFALVAR